MTGNSSGKGRLMGDHKMGDRVFGDGVYFSFN
jgi:hypothetical protein